jgi:hypothetical protein
MAPRLTDEGKEPEGDGNVEGSANPATPATPAASPQDGSEGAQAPVSDAVKEVIQEVTQPSAADDGFYKLSKDSLYQEIRRIASEDTDFDRRIREYAGRSNKRDYETRVNELETSNASLKNQLKAKEIAEMSEEDVEKKIAEDPEWGHEYVDALHPQQEDQEGNTAQWRSILENETDDAIDMAASLGMNDARADQFRQAWTYCAAHQTDEHGFYDHDENGRFFDELYPGDDSALSASLEYFKRTINHDIGILRTARAAPPPTSNEGGEAQGAAEGTTEPADGEGAAPAAPAQAQAPAVPAAQVAPATQAPGNRRPVGIVNEGMAAQTPDDSRGGSGGNESLRTYTSEEIREWTPATRLEFFKQWPGGRQEAIELGVVRVVGLSEELGYK